jgi:hypothetical protein
MLGEKITFFIKNINFARLLDSAARTGSTPPPPPPVTSLVIFKAEDLTLNYLTFTKCYVFKHRTYNDCAFSQLKSPINYSN